MTEALNPPRIDAFFIWSNTHSVIMPNSRRDGERTGTNSDVTILSVSHMCNEKCEKK